MENNRDKVKGMEENKVGSMAAGEEEEEEGTVGSSLTMERVAAAKQFIENHYRSQMRHIQDRKQR